MLLHNTGPDPLPPNDCPRGLTEIHTIEMIDPSADCVPFLTPGPVSAKVNPGKPVNKGPEPLPNGDTTCMNDPMRILLGSPLPNCCKPKSSHGDTEDASDENGNATG